MEANELVRRDSTAGEDEFDNDSVSQSADSSGEGPEQANVYQQYGSTGFPAVGGAALHGSVAPQRLHPTANSFPHTLQQAHGGLVQASDYYYPTVRAIDR